MAQFSVPCIVYRGGTSRGLFFHKKDLPKNYEQVKKVFLHGVDYQNLSQINGLGSGTSHSSKVVVISPPSVEGADLDYTFYQIGIGEAVVDDKGTCGNLMAGVGAFAVDEGFVSASATDQFVEVNAFNTNIKKMLRLKVPVVNGRAKVSGDYHMPGLVGTGAKITVDILSPGGGKTGKTLPLGTGSAIEIANKDYQVSFVDIVNPYVYIAAEDLGIKGTELNSVLSTNQELLEQLEMFRVKMAVQTGMVASEQEAKDMPAIPKIGIVTAPQDYVTSTGQVIKATDVDIVAKTISMGKFHRTFTGSGLYNLAGAVLLDGTVPNAFSNAKASAGSQIIRIGHPEGVAEVRVALTEDQQDVAYVGLDRTARRIMDGQIYIPEL